MDSGINFIDFLKYGAIGIALALAILSYRLLSKEQEKEHVRDAMLKSIKTFFILSILLSLFFGVTEIITLGMSNDPVPEKGKGVKKIWKRHLSEYPDKSYEDKYDRIEDYVELGQEKRDASDCSDLQDEVAELTAELKKNDGGGFYAIVAKLDGLIYTFDNKFINLSHRQDLKAEVFQLLPSLLQSLEITSLADNPSNEEILSAWCSLKKSWKMPEKHQKNIYTGDIPRLLNDYHKILADRNI
jgi:hypothetical protein